jgi:DNA invertase Pin-like site-specific DNA recombinase
MTVPTRVCCYDRFSPRPADQAAEASEKLLVDLEAYCIKNGWPYDPDLAFTDSAISGDDWDRPGLWNAIRSLKPGAVLLCRGTDRIARDSGIVAFVLHQVRSRGATIHTLESGPVDPNDPVSRFLFQIMGAFAELQRALFSRRSKKAHEIKLTHGVYTNIHLPYGQRWVDREAGRVEPDPIEQANLVKIRQLAAAGCGEPEIAKRLNDSGVTWRDGQPWTRQRVRRVLKPGRSRRRKVKMPKL